MAAVVVGWLSLAGVLALSPIQYLGVGLVVVGVGLFVAVRVEPDWPRDGL